jgi:hypothetical protein
VFRSRVHQLKLGLLIAILSVAAACGPFGDDDDDPPRQPTATREIIVATFTPTEVVPPDVQTATAEAQATGAAMTATELARNPPPTPTFANPTVPEGELLTPPLATITSPTGEIPSMHGSHGWVFSDALETVSAFQVPFIDLNEHEPVTVANGAELVISLSGTEYRTPPLTMDVGVYNFDENSGIPISQTGEVGSELWFVVKTDPDQQLDLDPGDPRFTIDVPPGHYAIRVQGHWPDHPSVTSTPIFVTWAFNVEVA